MTLRKGQPEITKWKDLVNINVKNLYILSTISKEKIASAHLKLIEPEINELRS